MCAVRVMHEMKYPLWTGHVFVVSFAGAKGHCLRMISVTVVYTFCVKPKWQMVVLWIFGSLEHRDTGCQCECVCSKPRGNGLLPSTVPSTREPLTTASWGTTSDWWLMG